MGARQREAVGRGVTLLIEVIDGEAVLVGWDVVGAERSGLVEIDVSETLGGRPVTCLAVWDYQGMGDAPYQVVLTLPASLRRVLPRALADHGELLGLRMLGSVDIGEGAFEGCASLRRVDFAQGQRRIGRRAFAGCRSLSDVRLPEGLREIADEAFCDCLFLSPAELPRSVVSVGARAFALPNGGLGMGDAHLVLPECLEEVGDEAFFGRGYDKVRVPASVRRMGERVFESPEAGRYLHVAEVVCDEGSYAEAWCHEHGEPCGTRPWAETCLEFRDENGDWWDYSLDEDGLAYVERFYLRDYADDEVEIAVPDAIEGHPVRGVSASCFPRPTAETVLEIGSWAPARLVLGAEVSAIEPRAFEGCGWLGSIELPAGITSIGRRAFAACARLEEVELPEGVTDIGDEAFFGCDYIDELVLPETLGRIGDGAFSGGFGVSELTLPYGLEEIGADCFRDGPSLVYVPDTVLSIGEGAFGSPGEYGYVSAVCVPGSFAQRWCTERGYGISCILPSHWGGDEDAPEVELLEWEGWTFEGYDYEYGATTVVSWGGHERHLVVPELLLGVNVDTIGEGCFRDHTELEEVVLPHTVDAIGAGAFSGCTSLRLAYLPFTVRKIADDAFAGADDLVVVCHANSLAVDWCEEHGIRYGAFSPLDPWPDRSMREDIVRKYDRR